MEGDGGEVSPRRKRVEETRRTERSLLREDRSIAVQRDTHRGGSPELGPEDERRATEEGRGSRRRKCPRDRAGRSTRFSDQGATPRSARHTLSCFASEEYTEFRD